MYDQPGTNEKGFKINQGYATNRREYYNNWHSKARWGRIHPTSSVLHHTQKVHFLLPSSSFGMLNYNDSSLYHP
jgi:hypothetical protein